MKLLTTPCQQTRNPLKANPDSARRFELRPYARALTPSVGARPGPALLKVLILEDTPEVGQVLKLLLEAGDHLAEVRPGLEAGLQRLREEPFDLVLTNWGHAGPAGLADTKGYRLLSQLHRVANAPPVLVLTGHPDRGGIRALAGSLDSEVLFKPFSVVALFAAVARAVSRHSRRGISEALRSTPS